MNPPGLPTSPVSNDASSPPADDAALRRVVEEAFDLAATDPELARALFAELVRGTLPPARTHAALSAVQHRILAERVAREPHRAASWIEASALLLRTQAEVVQARLDAAARIETDRLRLEGRLEEHAAALDEAAQALQAVAEQGESLRRQLSERAALLSMMLEAMPSAVIACDADRRIVLSNAAAKAMTGLSVSDALASPDLERTLAPRTADGLPLPADELPIFRALAGESVDRAELQIRDAQSGELRDVVNSARTLVDGEGRRYGALVVFTDVTEQRVAQKNLEASERRFRQLVANSPGMSFRCSLYDGWRLTYASETAEIITGYPPSHFVGGAPWSSIMAPEDVAPTERSIARQLLDDQQTIRVEYRIRRRDGEERWCEALARVVARPSEDGRGETPGFEGIVVDITARRAAQLALADREAILRALFDQAPVMQALVGVDGTLLDANDLCFEFSGWRREDEIGKKLWDTSWWDQTPESHEYIREAVKAAREGRIFRERTDYRVAGGRQRRVDLVLSPIRDASGAIINLFSAGVDVTENETAQRALAESEARHRVLSEAIPHQVWTARPDGMFDYANARLLEYFALTEERFAGRGWTAFTHPDDAERSAAQWSAALRSGAPYETEIRLRRADGEYRWHAVRALPLDDANGEPVRWFGINFDVEELRRAKDAAEHAARMKSAFLSSMSHEIRTPMNAVLGFSDLLADTVLDPRQQEFLASIRTSGEHLLDLINDILDFSKMEAGLLELDRRAFDLRIVAEAALDIVSPNAADKALELACMIREDVPPGLVADEGRLRQVLVNLLGNAVKFTAHGEVVVAVDAEPRGGGEWDFHFSVRDTGIGIAPDVLPRLFQEFSQGETSIARRYGGTGLGLAISRRIVEMHGGRIWAESAEGLGSIFHFSLPATAAPGLESRPAAHGLHGLRLLAVDDNAASLQIVHLQARSWGMEVRATRDPRQALAWVEGGERFDAAVLDHHMPDLDGTGLARALAAAWADRPAPVVLLSSLGAQIRDPAIAAVVTKPVHQSALQEALAAAMHLGVRSYASAPAEPERDLAGLRVLLAEDNRLNQRVASLLLGRLGLHADVVDDGRAAVDAVARSRYDVVLMDVEMPVLDGLEATRAIVRRHGTDRPRIVAVTAQALSGDRERCLEAGMDDYLSKPIDPDALGAALSRVARRSVRDAVADERGISAVSPPKTERAFDGPPPDDFDPREFRSVRATFEDAGTREIVAALASELPSQLESLARSLRDGDAKTLTRIAHTFKSGAQMFGAHDLANLCLRIEMLGRDGNLEGARELSGEMAARVGALVARLSEEAAAL